MLFDNSGGAISSRFLAARHHVAARARAQQGERMRRIGNLMNLAADDPQGKARNAAFEQALQQYGWIVGRNVQIDVRWGGGDAARVRRVRGGIGGARTGRHPLHRRYNDRTAATSDSHRADCVRKYDRSCRRRICRESGEARREYHWFFRDRIRRERQMARTAQRDSAMGDASGSPSRFRRRRTDCPICRDPGRRAVIASGVESSRPGRCPRDRARHHVHLRAGQMAE